MLTTIFSILTGGGVLGFVAMMVLRPALRTAAGGFLQGVPPKVWAAIAAVALLGAGVWLVHHKIDAAYARGTKEGRAAMKLERDAAWQLAFDKMKQTSEKWKAGYETKARLLSEEERKHHEQDLRRNAADADALRLRGPGAAGAPRCRPLGDPGSGAGAGGRGGAPAGPDAPGPEVPADGGQAVVPWNWLVQRAREHDDLLSEVTTWRRWYPKQADALLKAKRDLPSPEFGSHPPADPQPPAPAP